MFCILNKQTQILITFQNFTMSSELLIHRAPEFQTEHANECQKKTRCQWRVCVSKSRGEGELG